MVEITDDSMKHRRLIIDYEYTKEFNGRKKRLHIVAVIFVRFFYRICVYFDWLRVSKVRQKLMTDICTTDFARINLNKLLVTIAVELVLKLVISKVKKM